MKNRISIGIVMSVILVAGGCVKEKKKEAETTPVSDTPAIRGEGFRTLNQYCLSCHPAEKTANPIAPSLAEIKEFYLEQTTDEEEFVNTFADFLSNPSDENTQMKEAVNQFGIMPNMGFSDEQYRAIAVYLYHTEVEKPDWFETAFEGEKQKYLNDSPEGEVNYLEAGKEIALSTKATLGKNLLSAIKAQGTTQALTFCNERAIHLTDSMANALNASVKRVSDQNRNPENAADADELAYIESAKAEIDQSGKAAPKVFEKGGKMVGYYPIITNAMCLQCHGEAGKDIAGETLTRIAELYPEDKAKGYGENQLRGIWVIEMDRK